MMQNVKARHVENNLKGLNWLLLVQVVLPQSNFNFFLQSWLNYFSFLYAFKCFEIKFMVLSVNFFLKRKKVALKH